MAVANQAMVLLLPLYALEVSGSAAFAALVVGLRCFGVLLFDVPAGLLVRRFGDKWVLFGGLATIAASMLALSVATSQWALALLVGPLGAARPGPPPAGAAGVGMPGTSVARGSSS